MPQEVDSLEVKVYANANKANAALDGMITRLSTVATSLGSINSGHLAGMANGVNRLSSAMQGMKDVRVTDFNRLAKGIEALSGVKTAQINRAASAIGTLAKSISGITQNAGSVKQVVDLTNAIKQLGYKSSTQAIKNIPQLSKAMKKLVSDMAVVPKVSQNLIDMTNALAQLARTGASSGKAATALGNSLKSYSSTADTARKKSHSLASTIGKMYASYWLVIRAVQKLSSAVEYASKLTEVQNVIDVTFGNAAKKVDEFATDSIKQFGMSELAVKQYAGRFQAMGTAMGIGKSQIKSANTYLNKQTDGYIGLSDSMSDVSLNLTKLTADIASFYDVEQSDVAKDLESIFTGQTRPLRQYGLDLTNATLQEWAMKNGIDADIDSMTQAEKTMLRYQYVLANTTAAQSDFSRTSETWSNQMRILKQQFQEFGSVVGRGIINAFKPFVKTLNNVMGKVITFSETVLNALGQIFGWEYEITGGGLTNDLDDAMEDVADNADGAASGLGNANKNAKKLKTTLLGIDELNLNEPDKDTGSSGGKGSGSGSGSGGTGSDNNGLMVKMKANNSLLEKYRSSIKSLEQLGEYIGNTLTKTLKKINWDSVYKSAKDFGKGLANFLNGLISPALFGTVGSTIAKSLNTAIYTALSFGQTFDFADLGKSIGVAISRFFQDFDFASLANTINTWAKGIRQVIWNALTNIDWVSVFNGIFDFLGNIDIETIFTVFMLKGVRGIAKSLSGVPTLFSKTFSGISKKVASYGADIVRSIKNWGIKSTFAGMKGDIQNFSNSLSKPVKALAGFSAIAGEFVLMKSAFKDLATGGKNVSTSLLKIATAGGGAFLVLKNIVGLANPIAGAVTALTGLVGGLIGLNSARKEAQENELKQEDIERYGESVDDLTQKLNDSSQAILDRASASKELVENAGLAEVTMAQDLADQYFNLAEKENLTNEEKATMQNLAKTLVEQFPQLADCYNEETGLIDATRDSLQQKIDMMLQEARMQAYVEELKEAYKDQLEAVNNLKAAQENYSKAQEDYIQKLKDVEEAQKKVKEARNPEEMSRYQQELDKANSALEHSSDNLGKVFDSVKQQQAAYDAATSNINTYTDAIKKGYLDAGEQAGAGYAEGLSSNTEMKTATEDAAKDSVIAFQKVLGIASPSKVFAEMGEFCAAGYAQGFAKGKDTISQSLKKIASDTNEQFKKMFSNAAEGAKEPWAFITTWFGDKWSAIKNIFKDSGSYFKSAFTSAYNGIKSAFSGLESFFKGIANKIITPIGKAVNGALNGLKWILKEVGSKDTISLWSVPKFASGTDGLAHDTMGVVNDQSGAVYKEIIVPPSGEPFIPSGRNVMLPLEKGTKIMPARQTKNLMKNMGVPHFAGGIGNFIDGWASSSSYSGNMMDYLTNAKGITQIAVDKYTDTNGWSGLFGKMAAGVINNSFDGMVEFVKKAFESSIGAGIEKAVKWALNIAADNSHGYDQANRWGNPDYDCSSLIISAFEQAGIPIKSKGAFTTANFYNVARSVGFSDITKAVGVANGSGLQRGDVLLSRGHHVAMYIGNGKVVQASLNEKGTITGGKPGDQTGNEIGVRSYYNFPWTDILRYTAKRYKNGAGRISLSDMFPKYAAGGFPEDGFFWANRTELVGQFSNGKTAVANNAQIIDGIEAGVYRAMMRANESNSAEIELLEDILSAIKDGKQIVVDGRELVNIYDSRKSRNGFSFGGAV